MARSSLTRFLLTGAAALTLNACAGGAQPVSQADKGSMYDAKITAALNRAADQASREGKSSGSLALLERAYKRDPQNVETAVKFARALRENGEAQKAMIVLQPVADGKATPDALTEFATLNLNAGKSAVAERYARKAVAQDAGAFRAWQILGIALDTQGKYKPAEEAFRKALDLWQGDPIPVMNNLALNLTNQERLPEALEIMERAKEAAPDRMEVERNLRIIRTLNESADGRPAPKPGEKPAARPVKVVPN